MSADAEVAPVHADAAPAVPAAAAESASADPSAMVTDGVDAASTAGGEAEAEAGADGAAEVESGGESKDRESKKKHKRSKDKKKRKKRKHGEGGDDGGESGGESAGAGEGEAGGADESASSSSESDASDSEAELRDADDERRRARKREKKERKEKRRRRKEKEKEKAKAKSASKKKAKKPNASRFLDMEVEVSSDEEVSADEAEGAEDEQFLRDLVVPDDEVSAEEAAASRERHRKKRRRIREEDDLDEEDLNLVKESLGIATHATIDQDVQRSSEDEADRGGERKRLKKGAAQDDSRMIERLDREKRERERKQREARQRGLDRELDELDDEDDFLAPEDDGEMMGEERPAKQRRRQEADDDMDNFVEDDTKVTSSHNEVGGEMSSNTKERLRELFGSVTSFFQGKKGAKAADADGAWGEEEGAEEEEPESDESDAEARRELERKRRARVSHKGSSLVNERLQRIAQIRAADIPERLFERHHKWAGSVAGMDEVARDTERREEAAWIFHQLFVNPRSRFTPKAAAQQQQQLYQYGGASAVTAKQPGALVPTIVRVLHHMHEEHLEIHAISTYHKDQWCAEKVPREARLTEEELMRLDELDEQWVELGGRRKKLGALLDAYQASAHIQNLNLNDGANGSSSYLQYATPTATALGEWKKLLSSSELSGSTELDDVQDALKVLGVIEECKKKQLAQEKRDQREYARRIRRQAKEEARRAKAEAAKRAAEEKERLRAEMRDSFEAGAAAAAAAAEEELQKTEAEEKQAEESASEPEEEEEEEDESMAQRSAAGRARFNRSQFSVVSKCWSINGTPALAAALGITPSQFAENAAINYRHHESRDGVWNVPYLAEEAIKYNKVRDVDEALLCARRYAAFLISTNPLIRKEVRNRFMDWGEVWTAPTAKGVREIDDTHEYHSVRRIMGKPIARMAEHPAQFLLMHQAEKEGFLRIEFRLPPSKDTVNRVKSLAMEDPESDDITAMLCELYLTNNASPDGLKWNTQRRLIIHDAMRNYLEPICHAHARNTLLRHAVEFVSFKVAAKMTQTLTNSGFKPVQSAAAASADSDDEGADGSSKRKKKKGAAGSDTNWRIFSFIVGDDFSPTFIAVLNRYGGLVDHLCLHFLKTAANARGRNGEAPSESDRAQYARKKEDIRKLNELISTHQPRLMVIDASSLTARNFKDDLRNRILAERQDIRIEFADPEVGRIYMNSARAELEFRDFPRNLRQAISMGRMALDPIAELAGLYSGPVDANQWTESANTSAQLMNSIRAGKNEDEALKKDVVAAATNALQNDCLALNLHPLQRMLPTRVLLSTMQRALVRMVNYVGVDINKVQQRPWLTGTLQFLTGLGPIKAKQLLDYVKKRGYLGSREELLNTDALAQVKSEDGVKVEGKAAAAAAAASSSSSSSSKDALFGPCVYRNCCAFLLIRPNQAMELTSSISAHPLDETRIHPDSYGEALNIVHSTFEIEDDVVEEAVQKKVDKEMRKKAQDENEHDEDDDEDREDEESQAAKKSARDSARAAKLGQRIRNEINAAYIHDAMQPAGIAAMDALDLEAHVKGDASISLDSIVFIVNELRDPFGDYKHLLRPFTAPSPSQLFYMLTGETSRTLREGMLMSVTINGIHPAGKGAYVKLDSGVRGFLSFRNVSDSAPQGPRRDQFPDPADIEREVADNLLWLKARLAPGLSVNARVLKVEKDKFMVELSTKSSDLNQQTWVASAGDRAQREQMLAEKFGRPPVEVDELEGDLYFPEPYLYVGTHPDDAALLRAEAGPQKAAARFRQRNITHTLFRNFSREEAVAYLRDRAVGEVLVRPSSLGTNHLTLTWKVSDEEVASTDPNAGPDAPPEKGVYFHVDILEAGKPNDLEIGTRLSIGKGDKYVFEDLDEVVARFVQPMLRHVREITTHKNWRFGGDAEIQSMLYAEKQNDRNKIPYFLHFATSKERIGAFQFSFLPNTNVKSSSIVVVPEGFLYHGHTHRSLPALLSAVKAEMSNKVGVAPPAGSQRAAAKSSSRQQVDRKPVSLPPYAAAAAAAGPAAASSLPPYAAAARPPPSSLPPYAGAAAAASSMPPYAPAPPQHMPLPPHMPPYAGAAPMPQYGAPMPAYGAQPQYAPYQQAPPMHQPAMHQQPMQQPRFAPPAAPAPAAAPASQATSGYVHPSRLGIVSHSQPQQQAPQQPGYPSQQGHYPPPPQGAAAAGASRQSRWGGGNSNVRNDDMDM